MRRKLFLLLCIILSVAAVLSSCSRERREKEDDDRTETNEGVAEQKDSFFGTSDVNTEEIDTQEPTATPAETTPEATATPEATPEEPTPAEETPKTDEIQSGDIVFTGRESIVFEYYVEDATGKTTMKVTMSEGFIRVDVPDLEAVGVMNTNDDTGFIYYKSNFGNVSMSFYNLGSVESISQLNQICENLDDVDNLERTTLDGRECIYGEIEDDGDILKLWYSEEYHILLQYILESSDGVTTMKVTSIEEFDGDMSVFEMPEGCVDLGTYDAEGQAFTEIAEDLG